MEGNGILHVILVHFFMMGMIIGLLWMILRKMD